MSSSNKWQVYNTTPLVHIIRLSDCAPLWIMSHKKVKTFSTNKEFYQFQVVYVPYLNLSQNKAFKDQIDKCLPNKFYGKTPAHMRRTLKHSSNCAIALIMF